MSESLKPTLVIINLPVRDLAAATAWYTEVLGHGPAGEPSPTDVEFDLRDGVSLLLTTGDEDAERAGAKVLFGVEDLAAEQHRLAGAGIGTGERREIDGALAWSDFTGPEGHLLGLVQSLGR
ncbi:VOC family protein [Nocardiopsis sp. CC223A]|uniref:VOC family protein n=1 Tax=Nocardiopsis sp. CC223A TaxID=3044051 RepID=UPI00278BAFB3|nr:VOC family protein [Nocardiopsis sp. CC223A]